MVDMNHSNLCASSDSKFTDSHDSNIHSVACDLHGRRLGCVAARDARSSSTDLLYNERPNPRTTKKCCRIMPLCTANLSSTCLGRSPLAQRSIGTLSHLNHLTLGGLSPVDPALFTKPDNDVIHAGSSICLEDLSNLSRIEGSCV
jgi:hypothetical protein